MGIFVFSKSGTGSGARNTDLLSLSILGGITELEQSFRELSNEGKFEVAIFNAAITYMVYQDTQIFREQKPGKAAGIEKEINGVVYMQAKAFHINIAEKILQQFIDQRIEFYGRELGKIYNDPGYVPARIYSAFYMTPLEAEPSSKPTSEEVKKFANVLPELISWVKSNTQVIS